MLSIYHQSWGNVKNFANTVRESFLDIFSEVVLEEVLHLHDLLTVQQVSDHNDIGLVQVLVLLFLYLLLFLDYLGREHFWLVFDLVCYWSGRLFLGCGLSEQEVLSFNKLLTDMGWVKLLFFHGCHLLRSQFLRKDLPSQIQIGVFADVASKVPQEALVLLRWHLPVLHIDMLHEFNIDFSRQRFGKAIGLFPCHFGHLSLLLAQFFLL